ncbi:hypothetical protein SUGI_1204220 [Cryptomeria japonica]|nr:hypothetical protein SUGI_1204220 [Cryptomeria japonica]
MSFPHLLPNNSPASSFSNVLVVALTGNGSSLPSALGHDSSARVGVPAVAPRSSSELVPRSTVGWVSGGSHNDGEFPPLVAATSGAGVVATLSATLGDFAAAEGLPTVLGTNVGGLDAKIPLGGFVPPKPGVSNPVLDLDTLATVAGASDDLPAGWWRLFLHHLLFYCDLGFVVLMEGQGASPSLVILDALGKADPSSSLHARAMEHLNEDN